MDKSHLVKAAKAGNKEALVQLIMDNATIAQLLKVPIGTVKSRISIGLKKLKEYMGGEY